MRIGARLVGELSCEWERVDRVSTTKSRRPCVQGNEGEKLDASGYRTFGNVTWSDSVHRTQYDSRPTWKSWWT